MIVFIGRDSEESKNLIPDLLSTLCIAEFPSLQKKLRENASPVLDAPTRIPAACEMTFSGLRITQVDRTLKGGQVSASAGELMRNHELDLTEIFTITIMNQ
jgi:hypothetical protein